MGVRAMGDGAGRGWFRRNWEWVLGGATMLAYVVGLGLIVSVPM